MSRKHLIPRRSEGTAPTRRATGEHPLDAFRREVERLFADLWGREPCEPLFEMGGDWLAPSASRIDVSEDDGAMHVSAEMPGMKQKCVQVSPEHNGLSIRGEKQSETEDTEQNYYRRERAYGAFARSIPLPAEVDEAAITATFRSGLLEITLSKTQEAQAKVKRAPITSA